MAQKGKLKNPKAAFNPQSGKSVRVSISADQVGAMPFRWSTDRLDWEGPYGWQIVSADLVLRTIIPKLHEFEKLNWGDIEGKTGSHFIGVTDIVKPARKRLPEIGINDIDQLFSLRLMAKPRIWGIRDIALLRILWWDPEHEICPSNLKHT